VSQYPKWLDFDEWKMACYYKFERYS
jgi:hypothetical protein